MDNIWTTTLLSLDVRFSYLPFLVRRSFSFDTGTRCSHNILAGSAISFEKPHVEHSSTLSTIDRPLSVLISMYNLAGARSLQRLLCSTGWCMMLSRP